MPELTVRDLLLDKAQAFHSASAAGLNAIIQFNLTGEQAGNWIMTIRGQDSTVEEGIAPKPNLTVSAPALLLMDIMTGKKDAVKAFMQGKLRVSGDMAFALKLQSIFLG